MSEFPVLVNTVFMSPVPLVPFEPVQRISVPLTLELKVITTLSLLQVVSELAEGVITGVGFTVIITVAVSHNTGEPLSHTRYTNVSLPAKLTLGS